MSFSDRISFEETMKRIAKSFKLSEITIAIWTLGICAVVVFSTTAAFFDYNQAFFENITVEAHGMVMDLAVIGVFTLWLNNKVRTRNINRGYLEQIDDFRTWNSEEASFRIAGIIKRLNRNGETKIDIHQCFIKNVRLESLTIEGSNCYQTNFNKSFMKNVEFHNCKLKGSSFRQFSASSTTFDNCFMRIIQAQEAEITGSSFLDCDLVRANFKNTNLKGSIFKSSDLENAFFENANLENTNFLGCKNLTISQILSARSIKSIKLEPDLLEELKISYPDKVKCYRTGNGASYITVL